MARRTKKAPKELPRRRFRGSYFVFFLWLVFFFPVGILYYFFNYY